MGFATHGFTDGGEDYLLARDSLLGYPVATAVPKRWLLDALAEAKTQRRFALLDACRERFKQGERGGGAAAMSPSFHEALARTQGTVVLAATTTGGFAYDDPERQNGVFSAAILDGLHGGAAKTKEHHVTAGTLADYVDGQVRAWVSEKRPSNRPSPGITRTIEGAGAELPLAHDPTAKAQAQRRDYEDRRAAALDRLRGNLGGPLSGALYDRVDTFLNTDSPGDEQRGLLKQIEEFDGSERSKKALAAYVEKYIPESGRRPPQPNDQLAEMMAFSIADKMDTCEGYQDFLVRFPGSSYRKHVQIKIERLCEAPSLPLAKDADEIAWSNAVRGGDCQAWERYQRDFPNGKHASDARARLAVCGQRIASPLPEKGPDVAAPSDAASRPPAKDPDATAWSDAVRDGNCEAFERYQRDFPDGKHASDASTRLTACEQQKQRDLDEEKWQETLRAGTCDAYMTYYRSFQNGKYASEAEVKLKRCIEEAKERLALQFVDQYYGSLGRVGCDTVSAMWIDPPSSLCALVDIVDRFEVKSKNLVEMTPNDAQVYVQVIGRNRGEGPRPWSGCLDLVWEGESWKLKYQHAESSGPCAGGTATPEPEPPSGEQSVLAFADRYYDALGRADCSAVSALWDPNHRPSRLCSMVNQVESFRVDRKVVKGLSGDSARLWVDVTGKARGESAARYQMSLDLARINGEWKLRTMQTR